LITSDSEGWPDADRHRRHKLQNGRMLAGTKTIFSGKASQNPSAVAEAFGAFSRSTLLCRARLRGLATWSHCLALWHVSTRTQRSGC